jgi:DNA mismatch endonuclease, patch repair protein
MSDVHTKEQRRRNMQAIRSRDTKPEKTVRRIVHRRGYRFRLHGCDLPGSPDIVLPRLRRVIFGHGCFWHRHPRCRFATRPATRPAFWEKKLGSNRLRDLRVLRMLRKLGWEVLIIWECQTKDAERLSRVLRQFLNSKRGRS